MCHKCLMLCVSSLLVGLKDNQTCSGSGACALLFLIFIT